MTVPLGEFNRNEIALRAEPMLVDLMRHAMRAHLAPWEYADRNPFPSFTWWPWIDKAVWLRRHGKQEATDRLAEAWSVLRHGVPDRDDY